ncbi:MAG: N,N-dimethylformamidase beta subunit family domain-containing protein, partial [Sphingorhabdus sp.]
IARVDHSKGVMELIVHPRDCWPGKLSPSKTQGKIEAKTSISGPVLIGATMGSGDPEHHFNGKIDSPAVFAEWLSDDALDEVVAGNRPAPPAAAWDFSADQTALTIADSVGGAPVRLINMPMRAVTGHRWTGKSLSPAECPQDYTAIHFHDDDCDDAMWPETLRLPVPNDLGSGIYAFHLQTPDGDEDYIPFFVLPPREGPFASIAFLAPTYSYLAYGNAHVEDRFLNDPAYQLFFPDAGKLYPSQKQDRYVLDQKLNSTYDLHSDGSGVAYASRLVPQVHFRPKVNFQFLRSLHGSPHQFNADLHLVDWMIEKGFKHDVLTDEVLHEEGAALLSPYRVIVTGTHPEYWSGEMLDAFQSYLKSGGRVMYMGGNGFFWVTTPHPHAPHVLEIRKWGATRAWEALPGERHHSTTGEPGGVWRNRGLAPQALVGVGFTGQGMDVGAPYRRSEESYDEKWAYVFDGIEGDVFGDTPSLVLGHGAAGFELDRIDPALGSPPTTVCLAQSFGHSKGYQVAVEELLATQPGTGPENPLLRSDIAHVTYPNGGAVFSVGSISFCGSLSYNDYDNDVSRLTQNILEKFLE